MCAIYVVSLCAARFGLGWAYDVFLFCMLHVHAFSCIRTFISLYFYILLLLLLFWLSLSFSLFLAFVCSIAPKRKSTSSQNPLRSEASSSSDPTPSSVRFCDDGAWRDFLENFCRRGIHLECHVVLSDFFDTDLPTIIHSRGWESLCDILVTCPSVII